MMIFQRSRMPKTLMISLSDGDFASLLRSSRFSYCWTFASEFYGFRKTKMASSTADTAEPVQKTRYGLMVNRKPAVRAEIA